MITSFLSTSSPVYLNVVASTKFCDELLLSYCELRYRNENSHDGSNFCKLNVILIFSSPLHYSTCNDSTYECQEDVDSVLETDALVVDLHGAVKSCGENIGLNNWCDVSSAIWHLISHLRTLWTCQWLPQPRGHKTRLSWDKLEEKSNSVAASTWRQQYDTMQPFKAFVYLVKLYSPKFIK